MRELEPIVLHQPVVDHARKILDIRLGAVEELLRIGLGYCCAAEACADRVNEHKIGEVEPRSGVVRKRCGIGRTIAFIAGLQMLWPDCTKVQIDRRRARTTIERKSDRAVLALDGVGGGHDFACNLSILIAHRQRTHGNGVLQCLAVDHGRLLGVRIGRQRRQWRLVVGWLVG